MLIIGGLRTTFGPVVVAVEQYLASTAASWRTAIFGLLLIVLFIYFESGVLVTVREAIGRYRAA